MSITVTRDRNARMAHVVRIRAHELVTDVGPDLGGDDAGPDPHDLFDAALGACKALTVLWYAQRKAIPVESIAVAVIRDATDERNGVYRLNAELSLDGTLTDEQRASLLSVAEKCPVHKLMTAIDVQVSTKLA